MIYGSTGLFFCFFLPAGAILFTTGVWIASGDLNYSFFTVCVLLVFASILGNITGYWFGRKTGPLLYSREDSKFFRKQHLKTAEAFYTRYSWLALTAGLFLPIIRTFACITAGIVKLNFRRFLFLTSIGSVLWITIFVSAGYFIGSRPFLRPWLTYFVLGFILFVTVPLVIRTLNVLKKLREENVDKR